LLPDLSDIPVLDARNRGPAEANYHHTGLFKAKVLHYITLRLRAHIDPVPHGHLEPRHCNGNLVSAEIRDGRSLLMPMLSWEEAAVCM